MPKREDAMLKINALHKTFEVEGLRRTALRDVNLEIRDGEFLSVVGLSGTGKTTLLKMIAGLIQPDSGSIVFDKPSYPRVGFMFQHPPLLPWKTALENVLLTSRGERDGTDLAMDCLKLVGLEGFENHRPRQLSGGMQTRVALAQTLLPNPELLLLDEPFAFLDEINRERMTEELLAITQKLKMTVVLVTHSISEAVFTGDRIVALSHAIRAVMAPGFARPRNPELRRTANFVQVTEDLRQLLRSDSARLFAEPFAQ